MQLRLFRTLDAHAIDATAEAGVTLFRYSDSVDGAYTVRSGKVALIWTAANEITPMDVVETGSILGLPGIFNGEYSLTARTVEYCELGFLPVATVMDLFTTHPAMVQEMTEMFAREVARMRTMLRSPEQAKVVEFTRRRR